MHWYGTVDDFRPTMQRSWVQIQDPAFLCGVWIIPVGFLRVFKFPPTVHYKNLHGREQIGPRCDCERGCLFFCECRAIDWQPVQGVPCCPKATGMGFSTSMTLVRKNSLGNGWMGKMHRSADLGMPLNTTRSAGQSGWKSGFSLLKLLHPSNDQFSR